MALAATVIFSSRRLRSRSLDSDAPMSLRCSEAAEEVVSAPRGFLSVARRGDSRPYFKTRKPGCCVQHPRPEFTQTTGDFGQVSSICPGFRWVMCFAFPFELAQFQCQHARTEMPGAARPAALTVREGAFDDQMAVPVVDPVDACQNGAGPGIPGKTRLPLPESSR